MAFAHPLKKLLEEVVCPICLDFFNDPVSIDCGHNFCRFCITEYYDKWEIEEEGVFCPQCRKKFRKEKCKTNWQLASMVENIQQLGIRPENLKKQIVCRQHKDTLKLFCEDDDEVICVVCDKTQQHRSHTLVPIEEAAQDYKVKLQKDIELLKKTMEEISKLESRERNKPQNWKETVKCQRQQILSEFEKLQLLMNEKKKHFLQRLEEEEEETLQRLNKNIVKLSQQSSSLKKLFTEIEEKCQKPAAELLKDVKGTLARSEQVRLQEPELIAAELKDVYRVPGMMEMLREFTDFVVLPTFVIYLVFFLKVQLWESCEFVRSSKLTNTMKGSIVCELHQYLEEQEQLLLARLAELDTEIVKSQNDNVIQLSEELPYLDMLISELEGKHQEPASEFLQDIRNTLSRCEKRKFQKLEEMTSELGKRLNSLFQQNNALKETLKKCKANVTLDPDTAHPCLVLSEDQKSVTWGDRRQKVPSSPKRFDSSRCVLGCEGFTSGKHYWEVELQAVGGMFAKLRAEMGEGYWVVGVARESVRRKGVILLNPEEGVWALQKQRGQYAALTCPEILLSLSSIFSRIRVSLDYEGGQVTFFNVEDETPLFTFPPACFFGERICPFFCVEGKGTWLRPCP
ncbi:E3 ubiquitin-protein ligase TRIM39-like [Trachemys scripta elegans]|uniref:E3 ubiquitin-protein ligase TRIM39-like n=1 Tax=Trachemys scripta elegans TaxID=31138 RepID=UPI001554074D|nr:E3 ubiquitin-protein ligase TRIM39-like [Trachemys scripta elegans]